MLTVNDLSMQFGSSVLFSKVDLQFTAGNCYGIIGANGAGKSTFIKILSGELEPTSGSVVLDPKRRMSVLKQDQSLYDEVPVLTAVIMGHQRLLLPLPRRLPDLRPGPPGPPPLRRRPHIPHRPEDDCRDRQGHPVHLRPETQQYFGQNIARPGSIL